MKGHCRKLKDQALRGLEERFDRQHEPVTLQAIRYNPPFYNNGSLIKLSDGANALFMVAATSDDDRTHYYPLNGKGADIHQANRAAGLRITPDNAQAASAMSEDKSFAVIAAEDPDIRVHLKRQEIDRLFSIEAQTGQCRELVDRLLKESPL
jgi:hypothetical protein